MKNIIKKILKEDYDWIVNTPSFIEITQPLTLTNPKNSYKIYWSDGGADIWYVFGSNKINELYRYVNLINLLTEHASLPRICELYLENGWDWFLTPWMKSELEEFENNFKEGNDSYTSTESGITFYENDKNIFIEEMMRIDLYDMGFIDENDNPPHYWKVTYFDENGVEFATKVNL